MVVSSSRTFNIIDCRCAAARSRTVFHAICVVYLRIMRTAIRAVLRVREE